MQSAELTYLSWATTAVAVGYAVYLTLKASKAEDTKSGKINTKIDLDNPKVVTNCDIEDLDKKAVFCRCWKSSKFPYCDGSHAKHNQATGDNLGPLIIQKSN